MPLVIKAVETFGREDAYHLIGLSRDLPQAEDTIDNHCYFPHLFLMSVSHYSYLHLLW